MRGQLTHIRRKKVNVGLWILQEKNPRLIKKIEIDVLRIDASEFGQTWADVGSSDLDVKCVVGGDQEKADQAGLADGSAKTMGAEEIDTEVPILEVAPRPDPGR